MAKTFTFSLDSFQITDTRSLHNDTDYVTFTLLVTPQGGTGTPQTLTKSMGDVNNGNHVVNLSFPNIVVDPTDSVTFNYIIANQGNAPSQFLGLLKTASTSLLTTLGTDVGDALGSLISDPDLGDQGKSFFQWLAEQIVGVIFANCDGPVAAEQVSYKFPDLVAKTANGTFTRTTLHPGTNSARGCGGNSLYYVSWHMLDQSVVVTVPNQGAGSRRRLGYKRRQSRPGGGSRSGASGNRPRGTTPEPYRRNVGVQGQHGGLYPNKSGPVTRATREGSRDFGGWRRGGDSNSRYPLRYARFRGGCDRPLCHLSEVTIVPFEPLDPLFDRLRSHTPDGHERVLSGRRVGGQRDFVGPHDLRPG